MRKSSWATVVALMITTYSLYKWISPKFPYGVIPLSILTNHLIYINKSSIERWGRYWYRKIKNFFLRRIGHND